MNAVIRCIPLLCALAATHAALAEAATPAKAGGVEHNDLRNAYFGDLHLHTAFSFDAYVLQGTRTTPDTAYRFAKGETVPYLDKEVRRKWPLDFLAVTDHGENVGVLNQLDDPNSEISRSVVGEKVRKEGRAAFWGLVEDLKAKDGRLGFNPRPTSESAWRKEIEAVNKHYEPGKFTTFIGYEWTSHPDNQNLHRNVIFKGADAPYPFTAIDSTRPEDLWAWLDQIRRKGVEALAIPHNGNASNGLMYDWNNSDGRPIDQSYALQRAANEPLTEISQGKGQSETHPSLSANDEFAGFEVFDFLLAPQKLHSEVHGSYVREALGRGLVIQQKVNANPFKYGFTGGSDFHNGLSVSEEGDYFGRNSGGDAARNLPDAKAAAAILGRADQTHQTGFDTLETSPGNLTGVWAEENTRNSIYAALRRKETFATSGTRLRFRFFGGWNYSDGLLESSDWLEKAYAQGVPMGSDLPAKARAAKSPRFLVWAAKDPDHANLDRVQVIKVWLKDGQYAERVFDVALSDGRKVNPQTAKAPAVGNTVDLKTATYTNSIGASQLQTVWQDPQFDARVPAVYYLRVIEIPTPRWSTLLSVKTGVPLPDDVPKTIQERGWSSPIWYTP